MVVGEPGELGGARRVEIDEKQVLGGVGPSGNEEVVEQLVRVADSAAAGG